MAQDFSPADGAAAYNSMMRTTFVALFAALLAVSSAAAQDAGQFDRTARADAGPGRRGPPCGSVTGLQLDDARRNGDTFHFSIAVRK